MCEEVRMDDKFQEHEEALEEFAQRKLDGAFMDLHEELERIEAQVDSEASRILMRWVRDAVLRVAESARE